jgi:hypothetical protein
MPSLSLNRPLREIPRPRHVVTKRKLALLRPFFRYSRVRDAYVLRVIGRYHGPVLIVKRPQRRRPTVLTEARAARPPARSGRPTA